MHNVETMHTCGNVDAFHILQTDNVPVLVRYATKLLCDYRIGVWPQLAQISVVIYDEQAPPVWNVKVLQQLLSC